MANIRKRVGKRGTTWQVQIRLTGKRHLTKSFTDYEEAVKWAKDTEAEVRLDTTTSAERRPLRVAIDRYVETVLPRKAASTQRSNADRLAWWYDHCGDVPLDRLTPDLISRVRDEIELRASGPTANRFLAVLSHVLTVASVEWGWLRDNPVKRVRRCPENTPRVRYLAPEETRRLLATCRTVSPTLHSIVVLALSTGMRKGEILGLRWGDVDLKNRLIVLHKTKNRERRGIPISDTLLEELRRLPRHVTSDLLFPSPKQPGQPWDFKWSWEKTVRLAKIEDFRFHDLRHTVASYMAMNGATEREIAEVLGHKTMAMVRRYSHLSKAHVAGLLNTVSTALVGGEPDEDAAATS